MTDILNTIQPEPKRDRYGRPLLPDPEEGGRERPWTRVTTYAKSISDTFGLAKWQTRMALKGVASRPDLYALAASTPIDDRHVLDKIAEDAKEAAASSSGANLGTALHSFTEQVDRGESGVVPAPWDADIAAYQKALGDAGLEAIPHLVERLVVCHRYSVAGTFDRVLLRKTQGLQVIADLKTGKDLKYSWPEIAIQLALYAHGDAMWNGITGAYEPMPNVDQTQGVVIHLPVGQGRCDLYTVDLAAGWEAAQLCMQVRQWRSRKDLARPYTAPAPAPVDLRTRIRTSSSVAELRALWDTAEREGRWTDEHTHAAIARKNQLENSNQ